MKHLNGIYTSELIIPVRKKTAFDYIRNFFFFEILEIHENFIGQKISSRILSTYIFDTKRGLKGSFNFNCLLQCFAGWMPDGETKVSVHLKDDTTFDDTFDFVYLDMEYVLDKVAANLLKYMRLYWKAGTF